MNNKKNLNLILINIILVIALIIVVFPLLLISQYNYPSADDWSFGAINYKALKNGEGILGVILGGIETIKYYYINWEGRFSIVLLASLQPGIWGEKYYGIVAYLMIGGIIFSELFLCRYLLTKFAPPNNNNWLCIPIIVPSLILQILYTPSAIESFYWYNGAVNYTFAYGLSLILLANFLKLATENYTTWHYALLAFFSAILAILIGGDNFSTSLSSLLTLLVLSGFFLWRNRKAFFRTWFIPILMGISLITCIASPGKAVRINANFHGETGSAVPAVLNSLIRSFTNIYSWTNIKILLMLLLILPFLWKAVKSMNYNFRFPGLFTLMTFCLYASQLTPNIYVEGGISSGRLGAILYYSYHIWLVGNVGYWLGWFSRQQNKLQLIIEKLGARLGKYILPYCAVMGMILVGIIYMSDLRKISSYRAYRDYRQGWAKQYAKEWDERLKILHDDSVKEVEFTPLSVYPEMLLYTDLQEDDGYIWVNSACATYYDKDVIHVTAQD